MGIKEVLFMTWMVKTIFLIASPACSEVARALIERSFTQ
uniref:Uncharacterized protein n=1 Tax=Trichinella nativa TaxID=6335 RepID=A0A0V1KJ52_9BILA